jgi:hypothetical protein
MDSASRTSPITQPTPSTVLAPKTEARGPAMKNPSGSSAVEPIQSHALTRESACGGMWRARAVSHQMISSEKPNPVANAHGKTMPKGVPSANRPFWTGQASRSSMPVISGRAGRQRRPIRAPTTAPAPETLSSAPNTPADPYTSRAILGASEYHCA